MGQKEVQKHCFQSCSWTTWGGGHKQANYAVLSCFSTHISPCNFLTSFEKGHLGTEKWLKRVQNPSQTAKKSQFKLLWVSMILIEGAIHIGTNLYDKQTHWGTV